MIARDEWHHEYTGQITYVELFPSVDSNTRPTDLAVIEFVGVHGDELLPAFYAFTPSSFGIVMKLQWVRSEVTDGACSFEVLADSQSFSSNSEGATVISDDVAFHDRFGRSVLCTLVFEALIADDSRLLGGMVKSIDESVREENGPKDFKRDGFTIEKVGMFAEQCRVFVFDVGDGSLDICDEDLVFGYLFCFFHKRFLQTLKRNRGFGSH